MTRPERGSPEEALTWMSDEELERFHRTQARSVETIAAELDRRGARDSKLARLAEHMTPAQRRERFRVYAGGAS